MDIKEQNDSQDEKMDKWTQTMTIDDNDKAGSVDDEGNCLDSENAPITYVHAQNWLGENRYSNTPLVKPIKNGMVDKFTITEESMNPEWSATTVEMESIKTKSIPFLSPDLEEDEEEVCKGGALTKNTENRSRLTQELHPMMNEIILELVFKSLNVESLKSCRLVCKHWRDVSMTTWRQKAVLSLTEYRWDQEQMSLVDLIGFVRSDEANMDNFDFTLDILKKPFRNYKFKDVLNRDRNWVNYRYCLRTFQEHIKFLEMPFTMKDTPSRVLVNNIILRLPNLRHLRLAFEFDRHADRMYPERNFEISADAPQHLSLRILEILGVDTGKDEDDYDVFFDWERFLQIMPNLETLKVRHFLLGGGSDSPDVLGPIWQAIISIREGNQGLGHTKVLNLTELDVQPYQVSHFPVDILQCIQNCQLPLKRLTIKLGQIEETNVKTLEALLLSLTNSLEKLTLITNINLEPLQFDPPLVFENLRELTIYSDVAWGHILVETMVAPKLDRLNLELFDEAKPDFIGWLIRPPFPEENVGALNKIVRDYFIESCDFSESESPLVNFPQLTRFECNFPWNIYTPEKIQDFGRVMPNLKHLVLPLNPKSFRSVCLSWPKLWTLKISEPEIFEDDDVKIEDIQIGDEVITGIPSVEGDEKKDDSPGHGNITNLKELTDFSIEPRNKSVLTDKSVFDGFLKLPRLHYLKVAFKEISDVTRIILEAYVPDCDCDISISAEDNLN